MLYTMTDLLTLVKQDMGIASFPLPVNDQELFNRLRMSALIEFSMRAPKIEKIRLSDSDRFEEDRTHSNRRIFYRIPKFVYQDSVVLSVSDFEIMRPQGYSDYYIPQGMMATPDSVIGAMSDIKASAAVAASLSRAMTFEFVAPDVIIAYNCWSSGVYEATLNLTHDNTLSTIKPTTFPRLRELARLDLEAFLYNQLKRIDQIETGVGTIQLKIDDWEGSFEKFQELLKEWDENGAWLTRATITYY